MSCDKFRMQGGMVFLTKNYSMLSLQKFWILICSSHKEHLIKLTHACMAIPITTATCERGFSTQNRIKTKIRNCLKTKSLDILMRLSEEGPQSTKWIITVWPKYDMRKKPFMSRSFFAVEQLMETRHIL